MTDHPRFVEEFNNRAIYAPSSHAVVHYPPAPPVAKVGKALSRGDELAIKAARARGLTDPLGAKGFRQTRQRVERESSIRRRVFAASVAIFAGCFGLILNANQNGATSSADALETGATNASVSGAVPPSPTNANPTATSSSQGAAVIPEQPTKTPTPTATADANVQSESPRTQTHTRSTSS